MPNPIKYTAGSETQALKKGNFAIGTGDTPKGPSSVTGYYNGVEPPTGGWVVYLNRPGAPGDLEYRSLANNQELITYTNQLAGQNYTTVEQCLVYFAGETDKICVNRDYEPIVTDGLTNVYDFGFSASYPRNGNTVWDLVASVNGSLFNGPTFLTDFGGAISTDRSNDYVTTDITIEAATSSNLQTICIWSKGNSGSITGSDANTTGKYHLIISYNSTTSIFFGQSFYGGSNELNYYANIQSNSWNYLVVVKTSIGLYDVYYNGSLVMSNCARTSNLPSKFNIGRLWSNQFVSTASISMVSNYNRALSETEILQNWNAQKGRFGL